MGQGSIAVNGVSLTVVSVTSGQFSVSLIPHTAKETNLARLKKGDKVNIETDNFSQIHASTSYKNGRTINV